MNIEENRLQTFTNWPPDAAVTRSRLAKAGFFYTNRELIVECYCCHIQIGEWDYGDQVMSKHKLLSPNCLFVLDPNSSNNVPNIPQPQTNGSPTLNANSLKEEHARLETFVNWPKRDVVTPESLAKSGFYYLKENDSTKCAFCDVVLVSWEHGDDPDTEHKRCSPSCYYLQNVILPRLGEDPSKNLLLSNLALVSCDNLDELGIQQHKVPKVPEYATIEARLRTYNKWPSELTQKPEDLAAAGFYFEGIGDKVRCFHCYGGLTYWDPHDDPWSQHARWFPCCAYVQMVKGQDFIKACSTEFTNQVPHKTDAHVRRRKVTETEIQSQLSLEPALAALNIGLHVGRVKQAIREKLEQTGCGFSSRDAIIEAALNIQVEEDDSNDGDPQISQQVSNMLFGILSKECAQDTQKCNTEVEDADISSNTLTLEEENRMLKRARLCKICMDSEVGIVFLPCGHLATCVTCAPNLKDCPVCRSAIKATVRTFLS